MLTAQSGVFIPNREINGYSLIRIEDLSLLTGIINPGDNLGYSLIRIEDL